MWIGMPWNINCNNWLSFHIIKIKIKFEKIKKKLLTKVNK